MSLDLLRFQAIYMEATEVYVNDVNQQASLAAIAAHAPEKLKDVLPKPSRAPEELDSRPGLREFTRDIGSY